MATLLLSHVASSGSEFRFEALMAAASSEWSDQYEYINALNVLVNAVRVFWKIPKDINWSVRFALSVLYLNILLQNVCAFVVHYIYLTVI